MTMRTVQALVGHWSEDERDARRSREHALTAFRSYRGRVRVRELARRAKVSAATISGLLQGDVVVSVKTATRIAQHLPDCLSRSLSEGPTDGK